MSRITACLAITAIVLSTCTDLSAGCRRSRRCRTRCCYAPCMTQSYQSSGCCGASSCAVSATSSATGTSETTDHESHATSAETASQIHAIPMTAQEKAWYDELVQKKLLDAELKKIWEDDSHEKREDFYRQMTAAHREGQEKATDATSGSANQASDDSQTDTPAGQGK